MPNVPQGSGSSSTAYNNSGANGTLINPFLPSTQQPFQFWMKPVYTASDGTYWTPGFDGPTFATNPWDYVKIAITYGPYSGGAPADRTPGLATVHLKKEYSIDKKKPIGSHGARITSHGIQAAEFDIEIKIWTPEQLRQLATLWANLFPPATKGTPVAFDVQHPLFTIHDVKGIQFIAGEGPEIQRDHSAIFRIRALEYIKPTTTNASTTTAKVLGSILDGPAYPTPGANSANLAPR